ncbi:polysaccharide biosynthesis/export family protein [Xanthobacter sp. TB0136]|uniref:polysaccharide biosynthesis/export family protein n=1 Tax=Xanthobacter sp. TB0136 TaxID=3459177 RepID=UPI00403A59DE
MVLAFCDWMGSARMPALAVRNTRRHHFGKAAVMLSCALAVAGCKTNEGQINHTGTPPLSTGHNYRFTEINSDRFRPWTNKMPGYRIGPGDKLQVKYFITREMDEGLIVGPDGTIAPRAIGQMQVDGMSLPALEKYIRRESRKELVDQKVVVALEEAASPKIYVGGMVVNPAVYKLDSNGISVLQGIMMAGGISETGRTTQVAVIRRGPDNLPMLRVVDVKEIIEKGYSDSDVPLMSGDVVFVPYSAISEVNLWIDQFINKVVPFQRQFSYTVGTYSQTNPGVNPFGM